MPHEPWLFAVAQWARLAPGAEAKAPLVLEAMTMVAEHGHIHGPAQH